MNPQLTLQDGSTTIEVYGGYGEIGGNCIVVKDRDRKIVFDNGIRFQVLRRYYHGRISPLGVNELRSIGAIPPLSVFEGADAVYISHFHLDHLGLLGAFPPGVRVHVPSIELLEVIEEWYKTSPTWLGELPHKLHVDITELKPYKEDEFGIIPVPVSHSAYPTYALVYNGYDRTVFYSADLRVNSPLRARVNTIQSIERVFDDKPADIALLEGTNIGSVETPIGPEELSSILNRVFMESELVMISIDSLDFELLTAVSELAMLNSRTTVISSSRLVDIIPYWFDTFNKGGLEFAVATELEKPCLVPANPVSLKHDVLTNPSNYVVVQEPIGFLEMLRQMRIWGEKLPADGIAILTTPEPLEAGHEIEEEVLAYWLYSLGVQVYRVRLSGHYYPHELKKILNSVKPKKLVPIHTRQPSLMLNLAAR